MPSSFMNFDNMNTREERAQTDHKYFKMREVFPAVVGQMKVAFEPGAHLCSDELFYALRGRCSFVHYMPQKRAKYGLKFFIIGDCGKV